MRIQWIQMVCLLACGCAHVYEPRPIEANPAAAAEEATARAAIEKSAQHDFAGVFALFDPGMQGAVSVEKLTSIWTQHEENWGPFVKIEGVRGQTYSKGWAAIVTCRFQKDIHTFSFYFFNGDAKISGSWNNPSAAAAMFIDALGHHHADWADTLSDGQMHDVAPPARLADNWSQLETKFGVFERIVQTTHHGLYTTIVASFGHTNATFSVGLDARGKVTGFHVVAVGDSPDNGSRPAPNPAPNPSKDRPQLDFDRQSGARASVGLNAALVTR